MLTTSSVSRLLRLFNAHCLCVTSAEAELSPACQNSHANDDVKLVRVIDAFCQGKHAGTWSALLRCLHQNIQTAVYNCLCKVLCKVDDLSCTVLTTSPVTVSVVYCQRTVPLRTQILTCVCVERVITLMRRSQSHFIG